MPGRGVASRLKPEERGGLLVETRTLLTRRQLLSPGLQGAGVEQEEQPMTQTVGPGN